MLFSIQDFLARRASTLIWALALILLSLAAGVGCGSDDGSSDEGPKPIPIEALLTVAPGLAVADFEAFGDGQSDATAVAADGSSTLTAYETRSSFLVAGPRQGSASAALVGLDAGLYMSPYVGLGLRLVHGVSGYALSTEGPAAIDAATTVISLLLLHPDLYHPAPEVQQAQVTWMLQRAAQGWPDFDAARLRYDELLSTGQQAMADAALNASYLGALETIRAEMPAPSPVPELATPAAVVASTEGGASVAPSPTSGASRILEPFASISKDGKYACTSYAEKTVTELELVTENGEEVTLKPSTVVGTALDYLYFVRPIAASAFPESTNGSEFISPDPTALYFSGAQYAAGSVAASSYWSYADIVGNSLNWLSDKLAGGVQLAPNGSITFPVPSAGIDYYEVRLFSGGYGGPAQQEIVDIVTGYYSSEASAAFRHNVATSVVEMLGAIPGADEILGSDLAGKVIQAATVDAMAQFQAVMNTSGAANLTLSDVHTILYNVTRTALVQFTQEVSKEAQEGALTRVVKWIGWGGAKTVEFVLSAPGKIAKGGALANRAYRLYSPDSIMELWLVAVGDDGDLERIAGSNPFSITGVNGYFTVTGTASWRLEGISPKEDLTRPGEWFTVTAGQPARFGAEFADIVITPELLTLENSDTSWTEYYPKRVELETESSLFTGYANYDFDLNATSDFPFTWTPAALSVDGSFTIPPPTHDADFPHVSAWIVFDLYGDILRYESEVEGAEPILVEELRDVLIDLDNNYQLFPGSGYMIEGI